jgi:NAD+ synthase (glutamine-hydrolysing)
MDAGNASLRVALAQINVTVGDLDGNAALISEWIGRARDEGANLVVFPEQAISGYPAEDLWLKEHFLAAGERALDEIAQGVEGIVALVGFAENDAAAHNSLAILADGQVQGVYRKMLLPNYGVFDERRYFEAGRTPSLIEVGGALVGLSVCEDVWFPGPPSSVEALAGARLIANASASPYHVGKGTYREGLLAERAAETGAAFALCNLVGGQDELVFDGHSLAVSESGEVLARGAQFDEDLVLCDFELPLAAGSRADPQDLGLDALPSGPAAPILARLDAAEPPPRELPEPRQPMEEHAEAYAALVTGLRDYVRKNGFERVILGSSGGIDSALVVTIAADALGGDAVTSVVMPSPHSSSDTQGDARRLAENLGSELVEIPIEPAMRAFDEMLDSPDEIDVAAENLQARIRGNLVMAISNRRGWLVLTTGNKSELSVGYATLYGDMAGGFAVLKDVPKTLVYELARYRNEQADEPAIPPSILDRAPSAELRPDQRDEDSLPPYALLDRILGEYVEGNRGRDDMIEGGLPAEAVDEVIALVDRAEYKRRQAPPGIRISPLAFGRDRRMPITNRFRG